MNTREDLDLVRELVTATTRLTQKVNTTAHVKTAIRRERRAVEKLLTRWFGRAPTVIEIDYALSP